jgi:hypothetical protein
MFKLLFSTAFSLALTAPLHAEMLQGADDPAFQAAITTLLAADDPAAVATLRDLAEAGNTAALVTLPFALQWVPPQGNLKEKNAQRQVGGVAAPDAAAKVHEATALWDMGSTEDMILLPDRAARLLAIQEPEKAASLFSAWIHYTGGSGNLTPALLSDDVPAMLGSFALNWRLHEAVYGNGSLQEEAGRLLSVMRKGQLTGWLTYVRLLEASPSILDIIGDPTAGTGLSAAETEARIEGARAVQEVWFPLDDVPTLAATAELARLALSGRAELLPVTRLCEARWPDSISTCEAAYLAFPGNSFGITANVQPFADVLDPMTYYASDRGLYAMIWSRKDPAAAADRATAEGIDACYAKVLAQRDAFSFGP